MRATDPPNPWSGTAVMRFPSKSHAGRAGFGPGWPGVFRILGGICVGAKLDDATCIVLHRACVCDNGLPTYRARALVEVLLLPPSLGIRAREEKKTCEAVSNVAVTARESGAGQARRWSRDVCVVVSNILARWARAGASEACIFLRG